MFDKIKKKSKLFYRMIDGDYKELKELTEIPSIESNQNDVPDETEYIRPPSAVEMTFTVDRPSNTSEELYKYLKLDCYGMLPYRKDGCNHCNMVNDCIKAKIAINFNRR